MVPKLLITNTINASPPLTVLWNSSCGRNCTQLDYLQGLVQLLLQFLLQHLLWHHHVYQDTLDSGRQYFFTRYDSVTQTSTNFNIFHTLDFLCKIWRNVTSSVINTRNKKMNHSITSFLLQPNRLWLTTKLFVSRLNSKNTTKL